MALDPGGRPSSGSVRRRIRGRRPVRSGVRRRIVQRRRSAPRYDMRSPDARDAGTRRAPGGRMVRRASARSARSSTRDLQQRLRRRGFRIAVDGVMGPETRSALKASRSGVKARKWNVRHGKVSRPASGGGGGGGGFRGGGGGGGGRGRGGRIGGGGGGRSRGSGGGSRRKPDSPAKIAAARTALQFGPMIAELERERARASAEKTQNLSDIASYFGKVDEAAASGRTANAAASEAALSDFDAAAGSLASLFGGSANMASPGAGTHALGLRAMLAGVGQSQAGFDNELGALLETQESDQKLREGRFQDARMADVADRLVQAQLDRGNANVVNLVQARMERLQEQAQRQNMALAAQEFGLKVAQVQEGLKASRQNRRINRFKLSQELRDTAQGGWGAIKNDPAAMAGLRNQLMAPGFIVGKGGGLLIGPAKAINTMGDALRSLGLDPRKNREIGRWRDSIFKQILRRTHANGQWRKYQIRGNKLIHTPSKTVIYTFR